MPLQISPPPEETIEQLSNAIRSALPDAHVDVSGGGGHFRIRVVSPRFEGMSRVAQQRLVYRAIADLMRGEAPPVHAVDQLETMTPR
ncbi:MAG: BolA family protein [Myxococcota bacterium]